MSPTLVSIVGHVAFLLTAISFFVKDIIMLRALAIFSAIAALLYNYFHPMGSPDWIPLGWVFIFAIINVWRLYQLYVEKVNIYFSETEEEMLATSFYNFNRVEFAKLLRAGTWKTVAPNTKLTVEHEVPTSLYFIQNGIVSVEKEGENPIQASDGTFIGEMSFINKNPATATVVVTHTLTTFVWNRESLERLISRNPTLNALLKQTISIDLTRKINRA